MAIRIPISPEVAMNRALAQQTGLSTRQVELVLRLSAQEQANLENRPDLQMQLYNAGKTKVGR